MSTVIPVSIDPDLAKRLRQASAKLDQWQDERDRLIVEALDGGASLREVARLVGLSGPGVMKIRDRLSDN